MIHFWDAEKELKLIQSSLLNLFKYDANWLWL